MGCDIRYRQFWRHGLRLSLAFAIFAHPANAEPVATLQTGSLPSSYIQDPHPRDVLSTPDRGRLIVLGFAGDLGFSGSGERASPTGAVKHGTLIPWLRLTAGVRPLLKADANFANLETVVSASPDLSPVEKAYNFMAEPEALRQAVDMGFSVLTTANNHAGDFGTDGIIETLSYLGAARSSGLKAWAGLGIGPERYRPDVFSVGQARVAIGAVGLGINHAGADGPGQPLYASVQDFDRVVEEVKNSGANLRILSAHYGKELVSLPAMRDQQRFRRTVDSEAAQIVFGHHSHVASAVEYRNGGLILYGLGNFMHAGTQDMSRYGVCRDFGIYAKAYIWWLPGQESVIRAVEVFPITGMHAVPRPFGVAEAAQRINVLNTMNVAVVGEEHHPVRLEPTSSSSGLACFGEQAIYGDELAARCRAISGPRQVSSLTPSQLPTTCGRAPPSTPQPQVASSVSPLPPARPSIRKATKSLVAEKSKAKGFTLKQLFD